MKFWMPFMAPCLGSIARLIRKNKHTKIISVLDNVIPHEKRIGDKQLIRYFVNSMNGFVAMSKSVLQDLRLFDQNKPCIFSPHPIYDNFGEKIGRDDALRHFGLDIQTHYILFFGIIRDYKGLDLLLHAFADNRLRQHNVKLIVAGEFYGNSEHYFALEKELNLQGKIIWSNNFVPDSEVKYYFCAADIIAQPYKTATQSGVTQIAYHFEKPMLVTNVGGLAEIVPNGKVGYVVEPNSVEIADALLDFFENNPDFSKNIKTEKEKYSWKKMTEAIFSSFVLNSAKWC
jgi:glycosyltransferase involved in cell wall biosynthesis